MYLDIWIYVLMFDVWNVLTDDTVVGFVRSQSEGIILHPLVLLQPFVLHHGSLQQQILLLVADNVVLASKKSQLWGKFHQKFKK